MSAANCRLGARPGVGSRAGELSGLLQPQNSAAISEAGTCFRCGFPPASPCIASALVELILPPGCAHRSFPHTKPQLWITTFFVFVGDPHPSGEGMRKPTGKVLCCAGASEVLRKTVLRCPEEGRS